MPSIDCKMTTTIPLIAKCKGKTLQYYPIIPPRDVNGGWVWVFPLYLSLVTLTGIQTGNGGHYQWITTCIPEFKKHKRVSIT